MANVGDLKRRVCQVVDGMAGKLRETSMAIWEARELAYQEVRSSGLLKDLLQAHGFNVRAGDIRCEHLDMPTAFRAETALGGGKPTLAFLCEYDALPNGHACGHNIIGTAGVAAGIALASLKGALPGKVLVIGTPAEESTMPNSGGKVHLLETNVFKDVDVAMMLHPSSENLAGRTSLAARGFIFDFHGKAAHAAGEPEKGINALDAVILTFNAVNALRQHVRSDVRIHGIITNGGQAVNIVPQFAQARFRVRSNDTAYTNATTERVLNAARAAALATGARLEINEYMLPYESVVVNNTLAALWTKNLESLGEKVQQESRKRGMGSTDFGNVSQRMPGLHAYVQIAPPDVAGHSDGFAEAARSERGQEMLIKGAKALAMTAIDVLSDPSQLEAARAEWKERIANHE